MHPVIIALDFMDYDHLTSFFRKMPEQSYHIKVGMRLFYKEGPKLIEQLKKQGHEIFLDLKLHDIPNTVQQAVMSLAQLPIDMLTVHATGGSTMMKAALEGLDKANSGHSHPKIIAITQLTSTSPDQLKNEQLVNVSLLEAVLHYSELAAQCQLAGVVCSAQEVAAIKQHIQTPFLCITPGVRLSLEKQDDQTRIVTPTQAKQAGADAIVVGRPIICAENPADVYSQICQNWNNA